MEYRIVKDNFENILNNPQQNNQINPRAQAWEPEKTMADFVQSNVTKSAVRELADPIADVATFNTFTPPSCRFNTPIFRF